jgi:hypothetical protein
LSKKELTLNMTKYDFENVYQKKSWLQICPDITLNMFVKEKLTLDMSKYNFEYVYQKKSWLQICPNMTLNMFVKEKVDFRYVQILLWVYLSKEELTSDMSKYNFEYVCQRKSSL